jgi:hypothetical protein
MYHKRVENCIHMALNRGMTCGWGDGRVAVVVGEERKVETRAAEELAGGRTKINKI